MSTMTLNDVRRLLASWYGGSEACLDIRMCDEILGPMIAAIDAHLASHPVEPTPVASSGTGDGGDKVSGESCPYCDDTGDVHGIDGEWKGTCICDAAQPKPEKASDAPCKEEDGCPTEMAVLKRFWRKHQKPEQAVGDGSAVAWRYRIVAPSGARGDWHFTQEAPIAERVGVLEYEPLYTTPRPAVATPAEFTDEMIDAMCEVIAQEAGETFAQLDPWSQQILRDTQRKAVKAAIKITAPETPRD